MHVVKIMIKKGDMGRNGRTGESVDEKEYYTDLIVVNFTRIILERLDCDPWHTVAAWASICLLCFVFLEKPQVPTHTQKVPLKMRK